jgi:hypothetical protein
MAIIVVVIPRSVVMRWVVRRVMTGIIARIIARIITGVVTRVIAWVIRIRMIPRVVKAPIRRIPRIPESPAIPRSVPVPTPTPIDVDVYFGFFLFFLLDNVHVLRVVNGNGLGIVELYNFLCILKVFRFGHLHLGRSIVAVATASVVFVNAL